MKKFFFLTLMILLSACNSSKKLDLSSYQSEGLFNNPSVEKISCRCGK